MKTFIHKIIEALRKAREEKMLEWRRSHIAYCIKNSDIKMEDLIPIPDDEYDKIVRDLEEKVKSPNETELIAIVDGKVAGTSGIEATGKKYKVKHRAEFGISILREYWGLGLGKALTKACIQCAEDAGYAVCVKHGGFDNAENA